MSDPLQMYESWHSYPSIFAIGHAALAELFLDDVLVEEKVDGSQFSFGRFGGELRCRSRGAVINVLAPDNMFKAGVEVAGSLDLVDGYTYRGEYLGKAKHNALAYDRHPVGHTIIFDINTGHEQYMAYDDKAAEAKRVGLEVVPALYRGRVEDVTMFRKLLDTVSVLGGQKVEGVVVKNYARFGRDKKALIGKFVSEHFKEVHAGNWRKENPSGKDLLGQLIDSYKTPARWAKAVQHLREAGRLEGSPRDIGLIVKEVPEDVLRDCEDAIKADLWKWAWPHIRRGLIGGLPEWYKTRLLEAQFDVSTTT